MPTSLPQGSLLGVIHLPPLPGAPHPGPDPAALLDRVDRDAGALLQGGARGCILENYGDHPFSAGRVEPHVVSWMAVLARQARHRLGPDLLLGINVLRNDPLAALAVASAAGADFIRVNVHTGAMVTDQGLIQGRARHTLLYRRRLGLDCFVAADVLVKHAAPLAGADLEQAVRDTHRRAGAEVLILTGNATGAPAVPAHLLRARRAAPGARIWLGSGLTPENAPRYRDHCHAAIVGTWLHQGSDIGAPLCPDRVRQAVRALAPR